MRWSYSVDDFGSGRGYGTYTFKFGFTKYVRLRLSVEKSETLADPAILAQVGGR